LFAVHVNGFGLAAGFLGLNFSLLSSLSWPALSWRLSCNAFLLFLAKESQTANGIKKLQRQKQWEEMKEIWGVLSSRLLAKTIAALLLATPRKRNEVAAVVVAAHLLLLPQNERFIPT